jgi:CheY-like chemotaxis protein
MPLRVLIVEDEPIVAMDLEAIAIARGHEVVGVAERLSDVRALADSQLDLALVDMNLKDGRTGPVVADQLCRGRDVLVIFITANVEQIPLDFCGALGAVAKPFTEAAMAEVIDFAAAVRARAKIEQIPSALLLPKHRGRRLV